LVEIEDRGAIGIGEVIGGRYEILSHIGQGGMSIVYKAKDRQSGCLVAVKALFAERVPDARAVARFLQETKAAARLDHPCLAKVRDSGVTNSGQPYLVMEFIDGRTLAGRIAEEGQLPIEETVKIFIQVCDGLAHAHKNKILHRDLKPSNIMLTTTDDKSMGVKILDFGIAKLEKDASSSSLRITQSGEVVGSAFYMSPEQARGGQVDQRTDLYSLGCTLYETLTGGPPHIGQNAISTIVRREIDKPLRMSEASLGRSFPPQLEQIVVRLLKHDPNERYQSALEVKNALLKPLDSDASDFQSSTETKLHEVLPKRPNRPSQKQVFGALTICIGVVALAAISFTLAHKSSSPPVSAPISSNQPIKKPQVDVRAMTLEGRAGDAMRYKRSDEAINLYKEAINCYRTDFGANTLAEGVVWEEIAEIYRLAHKNTEELNALNNALLIYKHILPSSEEQLPMVMAKIGLYYSGEYQQGDQSAVNKAIDFYEDSAKLYEQLVPPMNAQAGECLVHAGEDLISVHDYGRAEDLINSALSLYSKQRTPLQKVLYARLCLSQSYRNDQKYAEARDSDQQVLVATRQYRSSYPSEWINALSGLASDTLFLAKGTDAPLLKTAVSLDEEILPFCDRYPGHFESTRIQTLFQLGDTYSILAYGQEGTESKKARQYLYDALARCRSSVDSKNDNIRIAYEKLGHIEARLKHFEQAHRYYRLAMKVPGSNAKDIMRNELDIAWTYRQQGEVQKAVETYKRQLPRAEKLYGCESIQYTAILMALGRIYKQQNMLSEAQTFLQKANSIYKKLLDKKVLTPDNGWVKSAKDTLAEVNSLIGKSNVVGSSAKDSGALKE
jgi:serine/threonine protein kinase